MNRLMGLISEYFVASTDVAAALIEPVVHLGTLEELLTDRTFDEILEDAPSPVADLNGGEELVLRIADNLRR
jgi:S-adenosylmethionine synthetase